MEPQHPLVAPGPDNWWPQIERIDHAAGTARVPGAGYMSSRPELLAWGIGAACRIAEQLAGEIGGERGRLYQEAHQHLRAARAAARRAAGLPAETPADPDALADEMARGVS